MIRWLVSFLALILLFTAQAGAQEGAAIRMDPMLTERTVRPGDSFTYLIYLTNEDRFNPVTLNVELADVTEDRTGNYRLRPLGSTSYTLERFVRVEPQRLTIPGGTTRTVEVTVQVPRGAAGGRYGAIVFTIDTGNPSDPGEDSYATTDFVFRMASFLELVFEGGALRREAYAASLDLRRSGEFPALRSRVGENAMVVSMDVVNEGNVHVVARGELTIRTSEGRFVARYPLGGGRGVILPEATVTLRTVITRRFPPGDYQARAVVQYGGGRPITADLNFSVDASEVLTEQVSETELARFRADPPSLDLVIRPGSFQASAIEVTNRGPEPVELQGRIIPLRFDPYGELLAEEERGQAPEWIQLSPDSFQLDPGRSRRVRISARPPRDVVGGYYADVLFRPVDAGSIQSETGTSLLIYVGDTIERQGTAEIVSWEHENDSLNATIAFRNEGTVHVPAQVEVILLRRFPEMVEEDGRVIPARTEPVGSLVLPAEGYPVLPGDIRLFPLMIPVNLEPGEYQLAVRIDYGGDAPAVAQVQFQVEDHTEATTTEDETAMTATGAAETGGVENSADQVQTVELEVEVQ